MYDDKESLKKPWLYHWIVTLAALISVISGLLTRIWPNRGNMEDTVIVGVVVFI